MGDENRTTHKKSYFCFLKIAKDVVIGSEVEELPTTNIIQVFILYTLV